jgi:hypothetical protein
LRLFSPRPERLALKVRRQLTDEQRALRLFGSEVVIADAR